MDHLDGQCAPARQDFRCTRAGAEEFGQLGLGVPELVDGKVEHVDRVKTLVNPDRPSLRFIYFDEGEEHIELVTFLGPLRGTPAGVYLGERCSVIGRMSIVGLSELRHGQSIDAVIFAMGANELHERYLAVEIEGRHQAVVSSRNLEPDALTATRRIAENDEESAPVALGCNIPADCWLLLSWDIYGCVPQRGAQLPSGPREIGGGGLDSRLRSGIGVWEHCGNHAGEGISKVAG